MPKPTTGRVQRTPREQAPQPDTEQMMTDTLMTSVFTGLCLIAATAVLGTTGGFGAILADRVGPDAWRVGLALGLAVGMGLIVFVLRRFSARIKARSANLYRGAWIGSFFALAVIVVMAYAPRLMPTYCPPGTIC